MEGRLAEGLASLPLVARREVDRDNHVERVQARTLACHAHLGETPVVLGERPEVGQLLEADAEHREQAAEAEREGLLATLPACSVGIFVFRPVFVAAAEQ